MSVIHAVLAYDGKHVDDLKNALQAYSDAESSALIDLCASNDPSCRIAATWLVKALLTEGKSATLDLQSYFSRLPIETEWSALLHLLQSVEFAPELAVPWQTNIRNLVDHQKPLVSVWALDAWTRVALVTGTDLEEVRGSVSEALVHDKASMRARARHLAPLLGL